MNNKIIGAPKLVNSTIEFDGNNNILFFADGVEISNSSIRFQGDNSVVYFDESKFAISINVTIAHDSAFYFGKNNYITDTLDVWVCERKNIIVGNYNLIAEGNHFRTTDSHDLYSIKDRKRINNSKSILIGDYVWLGLNNLVLKGVEIGSGAVIGANSVITHTLDSNVMYAGNPVVKIKDSIYRTGTCNHRNSKEDVVNSQVNEKSIVFKYEENITKKFNYMDRNLSNKETADERLQYIKRNIVNYQKKNRFYK